MKRHRLLWRVIRLTTQTALGFGLALLAITLIGDVYL